MNVKRIKELIGALERNLRSAKDAAQLLAAEFAAFQLDLEKMFALPLKDKGAAETDEIV